MSFTAPYLISISYTLCVCVCVCVCSFILLNLNLVKGSLPYKRFHSSLSQFCFIRYTMILGFQKLYMQFHCY